MRGRVTERVKSKLSQISDVGSWVSGECWDVIS